MHGYIWQVQICHGIKHAVVGLTRRDVVDDE